MPKNKFEQVQVDGSSIKLPAGATVKFVSPAGVYRLQENAINTAGEGGRVAISADNIEDDTLSEDLKIAGSSLVINYRKDEPMQAFDVKASAPYDGGKRYSIVLIEHAPPA